MKTNDSKKDRKLGPIRKYAIWLLGRQEYSCKTMEQKFKQKGYEAEEIASCMAFLMEHSFISDDRYAENRARSRSRVHGNRRISMDLLQKGINSEKVTETVAGLDDEEERAIHVSRKFVGKELNMDTLGKIWRFMASRGFGSRSIKAAIGFLKDESNSTP